MAKHKSNGHAPIYGAYVFKQKDPAIDELRTIVEDYFGHRVTGKDLSQIHGAGGPSTAAMRGWFFGATKRPQSPTLEAAGRAIGFQRVWKRMRSND
jgi:hypothetical protein